VPGSRTEGVEVVIVVQESVLFIAALAEVLRNDPRIALVSSPVPRSEAPDLVRRSRPRVVVLDGMGGGGDLVGVVSREILAVRILTRLLVLTDTASYDRCLVEAVEAGAAGVLDASVEIDGLVESIRAVARGERLINAERFMEVLQSTASARFAEREALGRFARLTPREWDVLECLIAGWGTVLTAERLQISPRTVGKHFEHILHKLQVRSRAEAISQAVLARLATPEGVLSRTHQDVRSTA
jgi:DNA-binding NarL/FixJ family response regulator